MKAVKFSPGGVAERLPLPASAKWPSGVWDVEVLRRGEVSASLFTPRGTDHQTAHDQDELYVIVSGAGEFEAAGERYTFEAGDLLFVPAAMDHRFTQFPPDFAAWVIFFGTPVRPERVE